MQKKEKIIGSAVIAVLFIVFLVTGYFLSKPSKDSSSKEVFKDAPAVVKKENEGITVYVNGEVKNPGVYSIKSESRVDELIKMAGGFTDNADKSRLNLAKKLKDEDCILVENKNSTTQGANSSSASRSTTAKSDKVNINTATKEELKTVPGFGEVTAQKIIDYREKNGQFSSIEDLKKVGRIGDKTLEKIKDKVEAR